MGAETQSTPLTVHNGNHIIANYPADSHPSNFGGELQCLLAAVINDLRPTSVRLQGRKSSPAAICKLLLFLCWSHARTCAYGYLLRAPITDEFADKSTEENHNDNVPIEIHGEQHDDVCHSESDHVDDGPSQLLHERRSKLQVGWSRAATGAQASLFVMVLVVLCLRIRVYSIESRRCILLELS